MKKLVLIVSLLLSVMVSYGADNWGRQQYGFNYLNDLISTLTTASGNASNVLQAVKAPVTNATHYGAFTLAAGSTLVVPTFQRNSIIDPAFTTTNFNCSNKFGGLITLAAAQLACSITNNLVTTNTACLITMNNVTGITNPPVAICTANLITIVSGGPATATNALISWFIINP